MQHRYVAGNLSLFSRPMQHNHLVQKNVIIFMSAMAGIRNLEEWNWNGQLLFLPNFWTMINNNAKKSWQNLLKARLQYCMPSVQKPLLAGIRSSEEWNWNGQHLLFPNFWTMMRRNADKTFTKRGSSALCLRHRNHFLPEIEVWKIENGMVNIYCLAKFWTMMWRKLMLTNLLKAKF